MTGEAPMPVVLIADEPWRNFTWRRRHHVAWELAKNGLVLFVEPPGAGDAENSFEPRHEGRGLYSLRPRLILPRSLPLSGPVNRAAARGAVARAARRLGMEKPVLWSFFSDRQFSYRRALGESFAVCDIYDKFGVPTWEGMPDAECAALRRRQDALIDESDLVFTVSKPLLEELEERHPRVHLAPNGVDLGAFEAARKGGPGTLPGSPVFGFLGMLHYKVDFELLDFIAARNPGWALLLMGKSNLSSEADRAVFDRLKARKNVVWTGELPKEEIPAHLDRIDVGLVPLKRLELNKYADLLKVWEYFAAGKPVVAVDQGLRPDFEAPIRFAADHRGFEEQLRAAAREAREGTVRERCRSLARGNSWTVRVETMRGLVAAELAARRNGGPA